MQPVVHAQLHLRAELTERQFRQVFRVLVLRLPDQEIGVIALGAFQPTQPLGVFVVVHRDPGRRDGTAVRVVEVAQEADPVVGQRYARQRQAPPGRQVLHRARGMQHVPVHEEEVDTGSIAVLVTTTGVTLAVQWARLPADAAQGVALLLGKSMPLVPRGMPELVEEAMLRRDQPGEQAFVEADALASQRKRALDRHEAEILLRLQWRAHEALDATAEGAVAGIGQIVPDLVEDRRAIVARGHRGGVAVHQAPADARGARTDQVAKQAEARFLRPSQALRSIQVSDQAQPPGRHVEHQLQPLQR